MFPESMKNWYITLTAPITSFFTKQRVHPNLLTMTGFLLTCLAAFVIFTGNLRVGGLLILVGGTFDVFDGVVARASGKDSKFGSFFDSTLDRYTEIILSLGCLLFFLDRSDIIMAAVVMLALGGSLMVSYTRARAEALGVECKVGFFQRPERVVSLGLGAMIGILAFEITFWILAILANYTAVQRIVHVYRATRGETRDNR